jgi:hypothetical protein
MIKLRNTRLAAVTAIAAQITRRSQRWASNPLHRSAALAALRASWASALPYPLRTRGSPDTCRPGDFRIAQVTVVSLP